MAVLKPGDVLEHKDGSLYVVDEVGKVHPIFERHSEWCREGTPAWYLDWLAYGNYTGFVRVIAHAK